MKIAVSASGRSLDDQVDQRFGRAACFVVYDTEDGSSASVGNEQSLNAAQGAGIQAAQAVWKAGAEALITGHCGPKAFRALSAAGITVYTGASGTVREAVEALEAGSLVKADGADVDSHW